MYKDEDLEIRAEYLNDIPFLHCSVSKMKYKKFCKVWQQVRQTLLDEGHDAVFTCIPVGDWKMYKFQLLFGFSEVERSDGQILFVRKL